MFTDFMRFSHWLLIHVTTVLGLLHHIGVGDSAYFSEVYVAEPSVLTLWS
jgi:hypothetical protein